jgi:hypothetical protein
MPIAAKQKDNAWNLKSIGLRIGLFLVAWFLGSVIFGFLALVLFGPYALDHERFMGVQAAYGTFGIWIAYRIGARLLSFPGPRGVMFVVIRLTWCFLAYLIVGASVEVVVGHPTIAAGLSGIPLAVVMFFLPWPKPGAGAFPGISNEKR